MIPKKLGGFKTKNIGWALAGAVVLSRLLNRGTAQASTSVPPVSAPSAPIYQPTNTAVARPANISESLWNRALTMCHYHAGINTVDPATATSNPTVTCLDGAAFDLLTGRVIL